MAKKSKPDNKIGIKEYHEILWKCRDFEISHLWQRSVFLTAFLIAAFTFYGTTVSNLIEALNEVDTKFYFLNSATLFISLVGATFSILWIKMAKGSKAWYEVYESAIRAFEQDERFVHEDLDYTAAFKYRLHHKYEGFKINTNLFSVKGGPFSVSKINIGLGQVFLVIWMTCYLLHFGLFIYFVGKAGCNSWIVAMFGSLALVLFCFVMFRSRMFKSSTLMDFSKKSPNYTG